MIDFWQRFFGDNYYGGGSGFTPGGGTFPPTGGGGSDFPPRTETPFGQGPGYRNDLGVPFSGDNSRANDIPYLNDADPWINPTMPNNQDPRMVFNPDQGFPMGLGGGPYGLGGESKVYDPYEMTRLVESLRQGSPESLPNPAPSEWMDSYTPYGTPPNLPTYEVPSMGFEELFNPNVPATSPDMQTIGWTPPPGMPPGQELNFGASDFPNIPAGGNVSADQLGNPPSSIGDTYYNPAPDEAGGYPTYTDYPAGTEATYYPGEETPYDPGSVLANTSDLSLTDAGSNFQWPFYIDQFPDDTGNAAGTYPTPPGVEPDVLPAQNVGVPRAYYGPGANMMQSPGNIFPGQQPIATGQPAMLDANGNPIPGTGLTPTDEASIYNRGPLTPLAPGLLDQLRAPTDWKNVGQLFRDAAGNIVNAAGKVLGTLGDLVRGAGNLGKDVINNIMNNPGYSSPDYLRAMGYAPGQTGALVPGSTGNRGYLQDDPNSPSYDPNGPAAGGFSGGVSGGGGSYFHGGASVGLPHGATPVAGAFYGLGKMGTSANITALGSDIYARKRLRELAMGYAANPNARIRADQTRALVGGPPPGLMSPWVLNQSPMYKTGPYTQGTPIFNPAAFGGNVNRLAPNQSGRASIHFNPRATP